jgi:multicomponent K+:H+ antiporter subunit E
MKRWRWLPYPMLSLSLTLLWLLLANQLSVGHLLLGAFLGWAIALLAGGFWVAVQPVAKPLTLIRFLLLVLMDIVTANIEVARRILGPQAKLHPGFVVVPLELRDEVGLIMLTSIISLTPGTVSADISDDRHSLLLHCLDVTDPQALVQQIKSRYEAPLLEVFPCSAL